MKAMIEAIEGKQFHTAYGDSKDFSSSTIQVKTQSLCQGNVAALGGWLVILIVIVHCHKRNGHGLTFLVPISQTEQKVAAVLYVAVNYLLHIVRNVGEGI